MKPSAVVVRRSILLLCLAVSSLLVAGRALAADPPPAAEAKSTAPSDQENQAFRELKTAVRNNNKGVVMGSAPLSESNKKWNEEVVQASLAAADLAAEFRKKFPRSEHADEVAKIEEQMLLKASQAGSTGAGNRVGILLAEKLKQPGLSEDEHFRLRVLQLRAPAETASRSQSESEQAAALERIARQLIQEFPQRTGPYLMLLSAARGMAPEKADAIIAELRQSPQTPDDVKQTAEGVVRGRSIKGQSPEIQFTALDGREVDLAKLKGKVVLVDFWATWCGPCVAELPHVKEAYEKFHDQGFEIVAISFDSDKAALEKFVKSKAMPWPQYFDGQGWKNKYGIQYGIQAIPTMWLVDRQGKVAETNSRDNLAGKVERLLAERETAEAAH